MSPPLVSVRCVLPQNSLIVLCSTDLVPCAPLNYRARQGPRPPLIG